MSMVGGSAFSGQNVLIIGFFLVAYACQPLLIDQIKFHGGASSSTMLHLVPHYIAMVLVGWMPTERKLTRSDWKYGILVSSMDIINQLLKKVGLLYTGAAVYIVVDSSSIVWTAIWSSILMKRRLSPMQWTGVVLISLGISIKALNMPLRLEDEEFIGVILILISSVLMGLTFVLNERFMTGNNSIPGPNLVFMMGAFSSSLLLVWSTFWTFPRFDELVLWNIRRRDGSIPVIICCFVGLFCAGLVHSCSLWYLLKNLGAVTSGVLKGVKVACVFLLGHYFFCARQANQCLSLGSASSAAVCVSGVMVYSFATSQSVSDHSTKGKRRDLLCSQPQSSEGSNSPRASLLVDSTTAWSTNDSSYTSDR